MKRSLLIILVVLAADQALKFWVKTGFFLGESMPLFGQGHDWAYLQFVENKGMAFGLEFGGEAGKMALTIFRMLALVVIGYLLFVAAMPVLVWFYMKTPFEFIAGVFLIAQSAVILAGGHYDLGSQLQAPIAAVVLILYGLRQHLEFRNLQRELRCLARTAP